MGDFTPTAKGWAKRMDLPSHLRFSSAGSSADRPEWMRDPTKLPMRPPAAPARGDDPEEP